MRCEQYHMTFFNKSHAERKQALSGRDYTLMALPYRAPDSLLSQNASLDYF